MIAFYFIVGYLFGNFQTAYLMSRYLKHEDIREKGHGNSGASNAVVNYGWKFGFVVALVDILKVYVAVKLSKYLMGVYLPSSEYMLHLCGLGVFLGHSHPFYMGFRGGKGTACIIGILLSMGTVPLIAGVFGISIVTFLTDYIVIGTFFLNIIFIFFTVNLGYGNVSVAISVLIFSISLIYHLKNYRRILNGTEKRLSSSLKKK